MKARGHGGTRRMGASLGLVALAIASMAATVPWNLPTTNPSNGMPDTNGFVYALEQVGSTLYIGGAFTRVGGQDRQNLAAIDVSTGAVTSWNPGANREVWGLAAASDGQSLYATGKFGRVDGERRRKVAEIGLNGNVTGFEARIAGGRGSTVAATGSAVYVGGRFTSVDGTSRTYLAALHPNTGALLPFDVNLDSQVWDVEIGPGGNVWIAGNFRDVDGASSRGLAELEPGTGNPTSFRPDLGVATRDIAFGPDGRLFVSAAGRGGRVLGYDTSGSGTLLWEVHVDGDMQAIDATQDQVFAGGHPGAFYGGSPDIDNTFSLNPSNGNLTGWAVNGNGGKSAWEILATDQGLWVAGQFDRIGGEARGGIAFFPG
jgi:hypothetical protein